MVEGTAVLVGLAGADGGGRAILLEQGVLSPIEEPHALVIKQSVRR